MPIKVIGSPRLSECIVEPGTISSIGEEILVSLELTGGLKTMHARAHMFRNAALTLLVGAWRPVRPWPGSRRQDRARKTRHGETIRRRQGRKRVARCSPTAESRKGAPHPMALGQRGADRGRPVPLGQKGCSHPGKASPCASKKTSRAAVPRLLSGSGGAPFGARGQGEGRCLGQGPADDQGDARCPVP